MENACTRFLFTSSKVAVHSFTDCFSPEGNKPHGNYFMENACVRFLFTSSQVAEEERVSEGNECGFCHFNTVSCGFVFIVSLIEIPFLKTMLQWFLCRANFAQHYYQYARLNDTLPSVKRAFLRAKREMRGRQIDLLKKSVTGQ